DRPLTFLDHRLRIGDSLVGASLADLRQPPPVGRRRLSQPLPLFDDDEIRPALQDAVPIRFALETDPDDTLAGVRAKERALAALERSGSELAKWKRLADLWCAAWFAPSSVVPPAAFADLADRLLTGRGSLPRSAADRYWRSALDTAAARRFFHWELEFPEVFFDRQGTRLADGGVHAAIRHPPRGTLPAG